MIFSVHVDVMNIKYSNYYLTINEMKQALAFYYNDSNDVQSVEYLLKRTKDAITWRYEIRTSKLFFGILKKHFYMCHIDSVNLVPEDVGISFAGYVRKTGHVMANV